MVLSVRRGRLHPLLLVCISAISFSWIEAPYDWAVYAQFPPAIPRMPSWWPLNMTWGGLPASVPPGYIAYFALPAVVGAFLGLRLSSAYRWRRPIALLAVGLVVGFVWAFAFNAIIGASPAAAPSIGTSPRRDTGFRGWRGTPSPTSGHSPLPPRASGACGRALRM